jgi:RNA polymerase sigma-70 factor, ECF subfamily
MDDNELMRMTAVGDEAAFETLVVRYQARVIRFCYRYVRDLQLAEDIAQEVFLRIFRYAPQFEPRASFAAFLFRVATNLCLDTLKIRKRASRRMPLVSFSGIKDADGENSSLEDLIPSAAGRPEDISLRAEELEELSVAMDELPDHHKRALLLYELERLSYREVAEALGATLPEVKIWIYRARKKITECVEKKKHRV